MTVEQAIRPPAYQVLADDLRAQITSGRLRPGDRLPTEPQLCAKAGLSRSTVREALRLLASQHLVITTRGVTGGSFVAQPSPAQVADTLSTGMRMLLSSGTLDAGHLFELREAIEEPVARLAELRRSDEHLAAMRASLVDPDDTDLELKIECSQRGFHNALTAATGNPLYLMVSRPLYNIANERMLAERAPADFWRRVDASHRAILLAVERRDPEAAALASRRHIEHLRETYPSFEVVLGDG